MPKWMRLLLLFCAGKLALFTNGWYLPVSAHLMHRQIVLTIQPIARLPIRNLGLAHEMHSALSGAELTRRLLAFARIQPLQPQFIDLNIFLPGQVALLDRTLGDSIKVTASLAPDIGLIHADPSQVGNALLNLAINARDAMPDGGKLAIEAANVYLHEQSVAENSDMVMGDFIVLAVKDTGTGMSSET